MWLSPLNRHIVSREKLSEAWWSKTSHYFSEKKQRLEKSCKSFPIMWQQNDICLFSCPINHPWPLSYVPFGVPTPSLATIALKDCFVHFLKSVLTQYSHAHINVEKLLLLVGCCNHSSPYRLLRDGGPNSQYRTIQSSCSAKNVFQYSVEANMRLHQSELVKVSRYFPKLQAFSVTIPPLPLSNETQSGEEQRGN